MLGLKQTSRAQRSEHVWAWFKSQTEHYGSRELRSLVITKIFDFRATATEFYEGAKRARMEFESDRSRTA